MQIPENPPEGVYWGPALVHGSAHSGSLQAAMDSRKSHGMVGQRLEEGSRRRRWRAFPLFG